ncbi:MAG: mechanosensitive ion channel family protein, partial [Bacteroidales bacterium]|nr:mechanosensitive ion channel family protein [Bacteroidales bacterium]
VLKNAINAGAETVCQLIVSLLRYAGYITVVFVTLYMFGVDTTGVLASLGAFSVMVGLGAKNLITDILAGISIIMENDYRVGDIVNIGGFCGKVTNIGIRTTKVEDIDGNVKIFSNSGVSGVVNMTSRLSAARLELKISSQHSFEDVEKAFDKFFERIADKYPQIKGSCNFLGVQDATPAFNVFRISVPCDEIDRAPLRRVLIKEFSKFCAEENITKM